MSSLSPGQQQCMSDRGTAVSAIGAPESWFPGWKPAPTWQQFRDTVERAISCSPFDASQIASMRAGVARTEACYPCAGQQITVSGPCGPPDPASIAHILSHGGDPNPPIWAHCGPPKPLSYWQQIAQPYTDALAQQGLTPQTLGTAGGGTAAAPLGGFTPSAFTAQPGEVPVQPGFTPGPGGILISTQREQPTVTVSPTGQVVVTPPGASGGSLPAGGRTGPGGSGAPAAQAPGPVTSMLSSVLGGHPYLVLGGLVLIYFLFLRGKQ